MNIILGRALRSVADFLWLLPTALLLAWSFPPREWTVLVWFALIPFGLALARQQASVELYGGAFFSCLAFHLLAMNWLRTTYSGEGLSGPQATIWIVNAQVAALVWPTALWLGRRLEQTTRWPMLIVLPIVWTSAEFVRMQLGYVISLTPFPWLQIGTTQVGHTRLIQVADLGGVWAVSLLVALVNGALVDVIRSLTAPRQSRNLLRAACSVVAGIGCISAALAYGEYRMHEKTIEEGPLVCLMPLYFANVAQSADAPAEQVNGLLQSGDSTFKRADLLVWPEDANIIEIADDASPLDQNASNGARSLNAVEKLEEIARSVGAKLVIGCRRMSHGEKFNSLAVVDPERGYEGCYDKSYLVPWGEFVPDQWAFLPVSSRAMSHGTNRKIFSVARRGGSRQFNCGATICYDICFSALYRSFLSAGEPDFFVVASWEAFDATGCLPRLTETMARFRAIETRRAIVRNVGGGNSGIIDSVGRVINSRGPQVTRPELLAPVPIDRRRTLVSAIGDWPLPIGCFLCLVAAPFFRPQRQVQPETWDLSPVHLDRGAILA